MISPAKKNLMQISTKTKAILHLTTKINSISMKRKVTLKQIAKELDVSISTVSKSLEIA
jgi:Mn-dependent DtxR family transcriptional regulator